MSSVYIIGITGGIGCGKTFICNLLAKKGYPIFSCDEVARKIIIENPHVKKALTELVGEDLYNSDGSLCKVKLSAFIRKKPLNLKLVNAIVHPQVALTFQEWVEKQHTEIVIMECALLFESHFDVLVDKIVYVSAPLDVRIEGIMKRDGKEKAEIEEWMRLQLSEEEKEKNADITIVNDRKTPIDLSRILSRKK